MKGKGSEGGEAVQMKVLKLLRRLSFSLSLRGSTSAVVACVVAGNYSASDGSLGRIETVMLLVRCSHKINKLAALQVAALLRLATV